MKRRVLCRMVETSKEVEEMMKEEMKMMEKMKKVKLLVELQSLRPNHDTAVDAFHAKGHQALHGSRSCSFFISQN